ncbi:MAG: glycerate kinase [Arenibacter latericius]|nr:glycerate kinase [Arenibacter latericius]
MNKIVVASDSFKGSVSSMEIAENAELAIHKVFPDCEVIKIPVGDGGEGTLTALVSILKGELVSCTVNGPLLEPVLAQYGIIKGSYTAIIEMAAASGLTLIPQDKRNPMLTSTYGTGELIRDALDKGCRKFLIGVGGSATNDGGTGMLQALGFKFLDTKGEELGYGGQILNEICAIDDTEVLPSVREASFTIACDVNNPLSGSNGAAHVYAHQKGADDQMILELDKGLSRFAKVIKEKFNKDVNSVPGAGAAGGVGGGFLGFLNASLKLGIEVVLDAIEFADLIRGAELIITGEGKLDAQTGMGKTPAGILKVAKKQGIPVIAIGGSVNAVEELNEAGFLSVLPLLPYPVSLEQAMDSEFTLENIRRTIEQQLRVIAYYKA